MCMFHLCEDSSSCLPVQELSLTSWKAATQTAQMTNHRWKLCELPQSLASLPLTYSVLTAQPAEPFSTTALKLGGMMQTWCKRKASFATRWPSGRGLPTPKQTSGAQANSRRSCQLREWERRGWRCQQVGASAGEIRPAAWLSGWQGGSAVGSGIALHRCAYSRSAQHLCPPLLSIPPLCSTAGLTDACKAPEDSAQLPALSEVRPK